MIEFDPEYLRISRQELTVLEKILAEVRKTRKNDIYLDEKPPQGDDIFAISKIIAQRDIIKLLEDKGLIKATNLDNPIKIGLHIIIPDIVKLKGYYQNLFESIPLYADHVRIVYSTKTGRGKINGEDFKLNRNSKNRKIFEFLVKNPNIRISKKMIWKKANERGAYEGTSDQVIIFNSIITALRQALCNIKPNYLKLKENVTLYAEVELTD